MNYCSLKDIRKFDKEEYLDAVYDGEMDEYLSRFETADQEIIKQALYNEEDTSDDYIDGWLSTEELIDNLINSTTNADEIVDEMSAEDMDDDAPNTSFNTRSTADITRKINEIFKVDEVRLFNRNFQKEFLRRCIYDINTRQEVDARSLNNIIYAWKQELWSKIKNGLQITSISWTGNPTSEELTESINTILTLVESMLDSVDLSEDVKESLFFLANIDSLLKETGCIERDNTLKPFEHSMTMYSFGSGHTKMYHNWTKKEENDIEENSSPLIKFLLETIPCVEDSGEDTHGMYIGKAINNFSEIMIQDFLMKYPDYNLRQGIINGIYSEGLFNFLHGEEARRYAQRYVGRTLLYEEDRILLMNHLLDLLYKELLIGVYGNTPTGAKTAEMYKNEVHGTLRNKRSSTFYTTSIKVLNGLKKHVFTDDGLGIPMTFKKLIFNQMYKTVQNIYLSTSLNNEGEADITLLHDKQIKSQSSELTNSLVGRIKYFRRNPKAFQSALKKAGIVIDDANNFTILIPNGPEIPVTISKSDAGAYRFNTSVSDPNGYAVEGLMNVLKALMGNYCGLPNIYEFRNGTKTLITDRVITINSYSSGSFLNTVLPIIGTIFVGSDSSYGIPTNADDSNTVNLRHQYALNEDFALLQYVLNGYDNSNVVKSIEGTSLPNYGLRSSIYDYPLFIDKARIDLDENPNSVYIGNPILASKDALRVVNVTVNNGVDLNGQTKLVSQMSAEEHAIQGTFINFLKGLKSPDQIGYHYTIVDSDKSRQFYIGFDLSSLKINGSTLASLLNGIIDGDKRIEAINALTEYISTWQRARNAAALADILNSYAIVYSDLNWEKTSDGLIAVSQKNIDLINGYLKNTVKSVAQLRSDFRNKGVILWEEYHFTKGLQLNESYIYQWKIHETPESTGKWFDDIKRQVAVDLTKNGESIWYTDFSANVSEDWVNDKRQIIFAKIFDKEGNLVDFGYRAEQYLFNEDGSINENYSVVLNPIIEAYYYSDIICSNSFNDIYYGFVENQDNKSKGTDSEKLASRNSSGYKRTVHAGSPGHHLTRGWGRSSSTHVSATIIEDEQVVHSTNAIGESTDVEPQDGGAQRTMVEYFIEKWSLGDAAIGPGSSKTIWNDNQQGKSVLWKFASFDMSNDVRRASGENSTNSAEDNTRKALELVDHTEILKHVNFSKYFGDNGEYKGYLYTYNPFTGAYTRIDEVINNRNGSVTIKYRICDEKGNTKPKVFKKDHRLNSLYDIDQILGGAYVMTKEDSGLEYSDIQSEILAKIICDNGLHEDFIAYFLPKSAVKSGRSNMNEYEAWRSGYKHDPNKRFGDLWTFRMSTEHSRLMMNAEHEIDSSITETSQMISSLCQMGYTKEEANFVYQVISQIVETAKKTYYEDLDASDSARRRKLEKFVIDALESTKGTATGISDSDALAAFCRKNKIRLPLSMPAVLSKLAPAINSELTKEFIRRSYPGVAAVNAPSYNMIETYKFGDFIYDYTSFCRELYQDIVSKKYAEIYAPHIDFLRNSAGDKLINDNDINEIIAHNVWKYINILDPNDLTKINNPYIIGIQSNTEINQGDTLVYRKKGEANFTVHRLNSYIESDEWRHLLDLSEYEVYKWTVKPRNLEQPHLQLVVNTNYGSKVQIQQRFTEYDTDGTRAQLYFRDYLIQKAKGKLNQWKHADTKIALIDKVWTEIRESLPEQSPYNVDWRDLDPKYVILKMTNYQQEFLKALGNASKNNDSLVWRMQEGFKNKILDYTVSDEDFVQIGRIDSAVIASRNEDEQYIENIIYSLDFLNDVDKRSLFTGLVNPEGMLKDVYTNSSNVALVINSFHDVFFETSDSVRMLRFVRQMQKAYELDGREFVASEFLKQISRIKNAFNSNGISRNVIQDEWSNQLRWAIEARNLTNTSNVIISDIKMLAGQVALSAAYSKEYMWGKHDQIADVLKLKEQFFKNKLKGMVSAINAPKSVYDFAKVDKHGNTILFKIGEKELLNTDLKRTTEEIVDDNVNVVKLKGSVLCKASLLKSGKIDVRRLNYKRDSYTIIRCDSVEEAIEVSNSEIFSDRAEIFNLTKDNMYSLYEYMIHEDNQNRIVDHKGNYHFKHRFEKKNDVIKTKTLSSSEVEPIRQNENEFFELLKEHVIASEKDFVNVRARNLYNSFRETLKYIGVRTPSQAMQSFMPLEVAIFVGSGSNLVYIPAAMTWFQGADYDIDKSFMMQLQLSGDIVDSGSNLSRKYAFSNLAKLPTPNNDITFTSSEKIYNVGEAIVYGGNVVVDAKAETKFFLGNTHVKLSDIQHTDKPKYFDTLKTVLNIANVHEAQKVGTNIIFINDLESATNSEIDKITHRFVRDLNSHNRTKLFDYWSRVMKNKVMYNAYDLLLNPVNLILESMPIAFGEIKDFADASTSGKRETKITGFNFMDKFIICEQAQLGKKEIGIVATGIKSYLVQTNVGNIKMVEMIDALKSARNDRDRSQALNIIARMMFERDVDSFSIGNDTSKSDYWGELSQGLSHKMGDRTICLLANIDLQPLKELVDGTTDGILWGIDPLSIHKNLTKFIVKNDIGNVGLNIEALYKELTLGNANEDVLMALSALLSAATDNMKELILSKIRASESTMGLFCTMLMQGYSLTQILNVFASDAFGLIDKFSKTNIFNGANTHGGDIKTIIRFLLGETSLLGNRDWAFMSFLQNEDFLKEMKVNDNTSLYDFVKDILTNLKEGNGKKGELYAALRQILLFNKDNALVMLKWLNNKVSTIQRQYDRRNENEEVEDIDVDDDMIAENAWEGDEEFVDPDEYDYDESSTKTRAVVTSFNLKDFKLFRQFLEDCEYRNEFSESIKERTKELRLLIDQVIPAAEENKWSGKILKINQGLPKTPEELMKFITSLNSYVNRTLKKAGINMESFDLMTFLDDPVKQKMFIEVFDEIKYQQNILRTVMDSPNFRSMFRVLKDSYEYQQYAYVTRKVQSILENYANNYLPTHDFGQTAITEEEYRAAQKVVQESIEANWIARLKRTFLVNPGDFVYTRTTGGKVGSRSVSSQTPVGLSNADEFATFKYIMDNRVFPFLAERMIEMPTFATNEFLANLKPYSQRENRRLKATDFYKMDLNMVNIDKSIMLRDQYEKILKDFDLIKDLKLDMILVDANEDWAIGDWTIGELIYIYDIIQNKGKVGKNSFAKLFENSQNNPLYLDRINFLNALDDQEESISNIQIRDLLFNVAWYSDIVSKVNGVVGVGESPQLSVEWNSNNSKIAKVTVGNVEINIAELPSDYTFFSLPFSTQVSDIQFITSKDSKTSRHSLSDPVVLNALYHALDLKLSGDHRFIKITSTEEIERSPEMFASQDRLDDYKVLPAFYDNDTLYLNRTNMTTKEPLYALAEVLSWVMSKADPENWNRFLTEQMPTWSGYQKHANALRTEDPLSRKHMIFGRFVQEYIQDTLRNVPEFNALKSTTETQIQRRMEEVINSIFETKKEGFNYFEYNLEDFVGLIGLMSRQKEKYAGIKLSAQMEAKLNLVKRQLISEGKLEIIGEC